MEARSSAIAYKFGVLYVKPNQQDENKIFSNCTLLYIPVFQLFSGRKSAVQRVP